MNPNENIKRKITLPFKNLTRKEVHNLAIVAIITFYIVLIGQDLILKNLCGDLAFDYCAYWSGGRIINTSGYADIYNGDLLYQIQKNIYPQIESRIIPFEEVPLPYLPFFIVPFQLLSFLDLPYSYILWTILNIVGFSLYLCFFVREMTGTRLPKKILLIFFLSLPVFLNLNYGQVNIWLGICAGEYMRSIHSGKPIKAGFWLGGWLFKPQLLIFIIPLLLIRKNIKALFGFILSSLLVITISYWLIGKEGFLSLIDLIISSSGGGATSNAQIMMNWRMLGLHTAYLVNREFGWSVIFIGSVITTIITFIIFSKHDETNATSLALSMVGVFAATCAVTWHAHFSMSIVLIPPIILLFIENRINKQLFYLWLYMPIIGLLTIYIVVALVQLNLLPTFFYELVDLMQGLVGLILNLLFLGWAIKEYVRLHRIATVNV